MPYVSVRLTEGLGNRFFQVAAMLGYAATHGHTPILVRAWISENRSHPGPKTIYDFFPDLPVMDSVPPGDWHIYAEHADDCFTYKPLPFVTGNVKLEGCFQSEKYFPAAGIPVPSVLTSCASHNDLRSAVFMHVRRGDYLLPYCAHHRVDLTSYYRRALMCVGDGGLVVVCSDDIGWCKSVLPAMYDGLVRREAWIFLEGLSDYETLGAMIRCGRGAITANSTFSWWGAYWGCADRRAWFFPDTWGHPPLPPGRDIYPKGAVVLSAKN